jgi:hypothetical protein
MAHYLREIVLNKDTPAGKTKEPHSSVKEVTALCSREVNKLFFIYLNIIVP